MLKNVERWLGRNRDPLQIVYVVESMGLSGGVRVIVEHAEELAARGHQVSILTRDAQHEWLSVRVPVLAVESFDTATLPLADVHIATWFPTVVPTVRAARSRLVLHFCQGYEGYCFWLDERKAEIDEAYLQKVPKLVVSSHLRDRLAPLYGGSYHPIPPALHAKAFRRGLPRKSKPAQPTVLGIMGPWEFPLKGVQVALAAAREMVGRGCKITVKRLCHLPQSEAERAFYPASIYTPGLPASQIPAWYHSLDLLLFASQSGEGLGLPAFEAMAAGVPVVMTDIPSLGDIPADAASRVPEDDPAAMAEAAMRLIDSPGLWQRQRERGLEVAPTFTLTAAVDELERVIRGYLD